MASQTLSITKPKSLARPRWLAKLQAQFMAYLFLAPALLVFGVFTWYPIIRSVVFSFQQVRLAGDSTWVGLSNYTRMLGNPLFYTAWKNVGQFTLWSILIGFGVPIILALMVIELRQLGSWFQMVVYLPTLIPVATALLVWRQIYAPEGGLLNNLLQLASLPAQLWLQDPKIVKIAIIIIATWLNAGGTVLIYIAALREIPRDIYEAAEVEGASYFQRVRYLTLPLISSRMQIMLVTQIIFIAQMFTEPYILTSGGPANSTVTPVLELYRTAFDRNDFGLASAWSVSILVALSIFSILYTWLMFRSADRENA